MTSLGLASRMCIWLLAALLIGCMRAEAPPTGDDADVWAIYFRGEIDVAEEIWEEELRDAEATGDKAAAGAALYGISHVYSSRGDNERAIGALVQSLALLVPEHPTRAVVSQRLADLYDHEGLNAEADAELEHAMDGYSGDSAIDRVARGVVLLRVASRYREGGKVADAENAHLRAIEVLEQLPQSGGVLEDHLGELTTVYESQGRFDNAADVCTRRAGLLEKRFDDEETAGELLDCARLLDLAGRREEASRLKARALKLRKP